MLIFLVLFFEFLRGAPQRELPEIRDHIAAKTIRAMGDRKARQQIFMSSLNRDFRPCFDRPCPLSQIFNIEVEDASGVVLNPKAQGLFDDSHERCTTEQGCHWMIWTAAKAVCEKPPCMAERFDFFVTQSYEPPFPLKSTEPRARYGYLMIPRDSVHPPLKWKGQNCLQWGTGLKLWGFSADGKIYCAPPVELKAEEMIPMSGMYHEGDPVMNFIVEDLPMLPATDPVLLDQIKVQMAIFSQSPESLVRTVSSQGGFQSCPKGYCFDKRTIALFLSDGTQIAAPGQGLTADLSICAEDKMAGAELKKRCIRFDADLSVTCSSQPCGKIEGILRVNFSSGQSAQYKISEQLSDVPEVECPAGQNMQGWDKAGMAVCR